MLTLMKMAQRSRFQIKTLTQIMKISYIDKELTRKTTKIGMTLIKCYIWS